MVAPPTRVRVTKLIKTFLDRRPAENLMQELILVWLSGRHPTPQMFESKPLWIKGSTDEVLLASQSHDLNWVFSQSEPVPPGLLEEGEMLFSLSCFVHKKGNNWKWLQHSCLLGFRHPLVPVKMYKKTHYTLHLPMLLFWTWYIFTSDTSLLTLRASCHYILTYHYIHLITITYLEFRSDMKTLRSYST